MDDEFLFGKGVFGSLELAFPKRSGIYPAVVEDDCLEGGACQYSPDFEYDPSGNTVACEKCGLNPGQD